MKALLTLLLVLVWPLAGAEGVLFVWDTYDPRNAARAPQVWYVYQHAPTDSRCVGVVYNVYPWPQRPGSGWIDAPDEGASYWVTAGKWGEESAASRAYQLPACDGVAVFQTSPDLRTWHDEARERVRMWARQKFIRTTLTEGR